MSDGEMNRLAPPRPKIFPVFAGETTTEKKGNEVAGVGSPNSLHLSTFLGDVCKREFLFADWLVAGGSENGGEGGCGTEGWRGREKDAEEVAQGNKERRSRHLTVSGPAPIRTVGVGVDAMMDRSVGLLEEAGRFWGGSAGQLGDQRGAHFEKLHGVVAGRQLRLRHVQTLIEMDDFMKWIRVLIRAVDAEQNFLKLICRPSIEFIALVPTIHVMVFNIHFLTSFEYPQVEWGNLIMKKKKVELTKTGKK